MPLSTVARAKRNNMDPPASSRPYSSSTTSSQRRRPHRQRGGRTSRQIEWALISTIIFSVITFLKFQSTATVRKSVPGVITTQDQDRPRPRPRHDVYDGSSGSGTHSHFIVWMYPFPPPNIEIKDDWEVPSGDQILICPYKTACYGKGSTINLAALTKDTLYNSYILDHPYQKFRHMKEFCHHIQVIAMISLLLKNDGVCVQTLGGDNWFCSAESFSDYNPYDNGGQSWSASTESSGESDLSISKFPYQLLSHKGSSQVLSLAPDMTREEFATYGPWNVSTDVRLGGRYNSGEDIQSLAGVGWYPFLSSVRIKDDPLNNYSGYYIANSLQQSPPMKMPYSEEAKERRSLMEKLDIVSMFFGGADMIQRNEKFLREYTNEVYPFGCRSTLTCATLKAHKIRSYFSSCLTLTSTYQGSVLYHDGSSPSLNGLPLLNPALVNFTSAIKKAKEEKDLVLLVDVVDRSALPSLPSNARWLSADIPKGYPRSCQPQSERIDYCYRLLSQYANHAKVVITSRIHVGLPAAAMGIPVIFVSKGGWLPGGKEKTGRVAGLLDIFHRIDKTKNLTLGFDLSGPIPPNPGNHEADRRRAAFWHRLKRVSYYEDAARIFGQIPFQRLGAGMAQDDFHNNFHVVMNQTDLSDWRSRRTIEAVLFFHPNAKILIHVEGYVSGGSQGLFTIFAESGYDVRLVPISSQRASVKQIKMLLQKFGGVFLSKGTFIRGALPVALDEGYSLDEHGDVALMIGKKAAVKATNKTWVASYLSSTQTQQCMSDPTWEMESTEDIAITVDRASLLEHDIIMDTRCYDLIEKNCIYNDDLHWKYGKETGVLLKLSDGSTARYCEGQIWSPNVSCKERVEYMKSRHSMSDQDAMISTLQQGCLCAETDDKESY
mmetsp:Transcript_15923/g.24035  ORF Transcript_15923/g.24035 Transcript_15923/m.24035 type:complete len:887 (-) Transcript_15923:1562-4222(-)